jgi:hypothetical protein
MRAVFFYSSFYIDFLFLALGAGSAVLFYSTLQDAFGAAPGGLAAVLNQCNLDKADARAGFV